MDNHLEELTDKENIVIFLREVLLEIECQSRTYKEKESVRKMMRADDDSIFKSRLAIFNLSLQRNIDTHEIKLETSVESIYGNYYQNYNALNQIQRHRDFWNEFNKFAVQLPSFVEDLNEQFIENMNNLKSEREKSNEDLVTFFMIRRGLVKSKIPDDDVSVIKRREKWLENIPKLNQIETVTNILLNHFKDDGINITPGLINNIDPIELFVKTKDKRSFALSLRSNGKSRIRWRMDKHNFYTYRDNGSKLTENITYQAEKLSASVKELIMFRSDLLGISARESRKPVTKAIILMGETKLDPKNDPALWCKFGQTEKVIRVDTDGFVYMLSVDDLIDFLSRPLKEILGLQVKRWSYGADNY